MTNQLRTRDRLLYGVVLPLAIMIAGLFLVMLAPTNAGAAEFAALGIFLGAITLIPVVLIINLVVAFRPAAGFKTCFRRGMIAPTIVLVGAIAYQAGIWDALF